MAKITGLALSIVTLFFMNIVFDSGEVYAAQNTDAGKTSVITVPAGKTLRAIVTTPISSDRLSLGQNVTMVVGEDFYYNNKLIAPFESVLTGSVIGISKATSNEKGRLFLRFTQYTTPYGIQVPVAAIIKTADNTGKLYGNEEYGSNESDNINIPVNTPVDLLLIQPITVNPEVYNTNY